MKTLKLLGGIVFFGITMICLTITMLTCATGCTTRADVINTRETLWNGTHTIREQNKTYLRATTSPATPSNALFESGMKNHDELQKFVDESRSHDSDILKFGK